MTIVQFCYKGVSMQYFFRRVFLWCFIVHGGIALLSLHGQVSSPKLSVIFVVDQLAHHHITKLKGYFNHGIKFLLEQGISYHHAHHPHGMPETSPGHVSLSTGALPRMHGIVVNQWYDEQGKRTYWVNGDPRGASASEITVDTLADQVLTASSPEYPRQAIALSNKDRAAIAMAGKMGKAFWFDRYRGGYTSSKPYFEILPDWVDDFNQEHNLLSMEKVTWKLFHPRMSKFYDFPFVDDYEHAAYPFSFVQKETVDLNRAGKEPYGYFLVTPAADQLLLNFARRCLQENFGPDEPGNLLFWISLSSLDLLGHMYGPDARESIDLLYHLDAALGSFINEIFRQYGQENVLLALTGDHGIQPIPEITRKRGYAQAYRLIAKDLIAGMNKQVKDKLGIEDVVAVHDSSIFLFDQQKIKQVTPAQHSLIVNELKNYLKNTPGIKQVWTYDELMQQTFPAFSPERFLQNSSSWHKHGDLICLTDAYSLITDYSTGASHNTPFDYNTHVPLVLYQKNRFEKKEIHKRVITQQLAPSLAKIFGIAAPSACLVELLPGLFEQE